MTAFTQALGAALLHFVWQASLVALVLWAVLFGLRRRPAAWRYWASCAALAILAALPVATVWTLAQGAVQAPAAPMASSGAYFFVAAPAAGLGIAPHAGSWFERVASWALPVWSLGVLFLSLRLIWGARQLYLLRRRGEPASEAVLGMVHRLAARMGIRQPVAVWISALADGPSVFGFVRPLILLPSATLLGLTPEQLEAVLAHELAHIRRFDYAVNLVQMLAETLLFYHPAVWWVSARIRHERELCCDDLAVESCGNALCYARALTRLERLRLAAPDMAMAATGGPLLYRIQRLMGAAGAEYRPSRLPAVVAVLVGLGCLALNVHFAKAQDQPRQETKQTVTVHGVAKSAAATGAAEQDKVAISFRPGGYTDPGVQVDTAGATLVKREPVEYPGPAIERNIQGTVTVEAILDANGDVSDAHVLAGPQELRKAALRSVLGWRFQPDAAGAGAARQVNITFQIPPGGFPAEPHEFEGQKVVLRLGSDADEAGITRLRQNEQALETLRELVDKFKAEHQSQLASGTAPQLEGQYRELLRQADDVKRGVAEAQRQVEAGANAAAALGRPVKHISVRGISEKEIAELMSRVPIRLGDPLTPESLEQLKSAVHQFNPQLAIGYTTTVDGQVEIHIAPAGGDEPIQRERVRK